MNDAERLSSPELQAGEALDRALRPQTFDDYVGQSRAKMKSNLHLATVALGALRSVLRCRDIVDCPGAF